METWLAWGVLGLVLVIAELLTGTFYLLMLGIAAFGAAAAAGLGLVFAAQAVIACVVAAGGAYPGDVHRPQNKARGSGAASPPHPPHLASRRVLPGPPPRLPPPRRRAG